MSAIRHIFWGLLLAVTVAISETPAGAAQMKVGGFLVNAEGAFGPGAVTYAAPFTLTATTRVAVQYAAQYSSEFGIIRSSDLQKWRNSQAVTYFARFTATTASKYINLQPGSYNAVARDLTGSAAYNGFAMKVRRFTGVAKVNGVIVKEYEASRAWAINVLPQNWNGIAFNKPSESRVWFQGVFSRGQDQNVTWEILLPAEYDKFRNGQAYTKLLTGSDPKTLQFEWVAVPGKYYVVVKNASNTLSSFTALREVYK